MKRIRIVILAGKGMSTDILYNAIEEKFSVHKVIVEEGISNKKFFKRRIKNLGYFTVFGQLVFLSLIQPFIKIASNKRIQEIKDRFNLKVTSIPNNKKIEVTSINEKAVIETIKTEKPDIIIINGTRIISKKVLNATKAPFVNIHAGITPKYRGVHGAYWALYNNDKTLCGVTVHLVDPGIDTGGVLAQKVIDPSKKDNYSTYPFIQQGEGINLLIKEVIPNFISNGKLSSIDSITNESKLWSHPTVFQYLNKRIFGRIK